MADENVARDRLLSQIKNSFGKNVGDALGDSTVTDILLNEDGNLWVERFGKPMEVVGQLTASQAHMAINAVATYHNDVVRGDKPIFSGELPDGSRFEANVPPIVINPTFAIRKRASKVFTLSEYVEQGVITDGQYEELLTLIRSRGNIIVCGSTGAGKTTLVNALISEVSRTFPSDRFYIIEDMLELQCEAKNKTQKRATPHCSMGDLLRSALRQRPDRILIGEVRGGEGLYMLKAWNTGHPGGICTLHSDAVLGGGGHNSSALRRLEQLCSESSNSPPMEVLQQVIAETVDGIVYIWRGPDGKRIVGEIEYPISIIDGFYEFKDSIV